MTRPPVGAIIAALVPFAAMCFSVPLWDRIHPMIFGLPFNLFWLLAWIVITPLCMWVAYRLGAPDNSPNSRDRREDQPR